MFMFVFEVNFNFLMILKWRNSISIYLYHIWKTSNKLFKLCVCKRLYEPTEQAKIYNDIPS